MNGNKLGVYQPTWRNDFPSLPNNLILNKLEETDPSHVAEIKGHDEFHDIEDEYQEHVRSEIIDWGPDAPFLESDNTYANPEMSTQKLNLRYNGTRGSSYELPRNPEVFIGFTGNDPRGVTNNPRFDLMRGQITNRTPDLTVNMGYNADYHEAERPWTNQSISYGKKYIQRQVKGNTKIFTPSKVNSIYSSSTVVADEYASGRARVANMAAGDESLPAARQMFAGAEGPAADSEGTYRGQAYYEPGKAPWHRATGETELGVHKFGQVRAKGAAAPGANGVGGGRVNPADAEHLWNESQATSSTRRQDLGASMALAARHGKAVRSGEAGHDHRESAEAARVTAGNLAPGRNPERAGRKGDATHDHRESVEAARSGRGLVPGQNLERAGRLGDVTHDHRESVEAARSGKGLVPGQNLERASRKGDASHDHRESIEAARSGKGLVPGQNPERAGRKALGAATDNTYLTNVGAIVKGLREGTAASRRKIAGAVIADGNRNGALSDAARMALGRQGAPQRAAHTGINAAQSHDDGTWKASNEVSKIKASNNELNLRHTTATGKSLVSYNTAIQGLPVEAGGGYGAVAPKRLRPESSGFDRSSGFAENSSAERDLHD